MIWIGSRVILNNLSVFELVIVIVFIAALVIIAFKVHRDKENNSNTESKIYDGIEMRPIINVRRASINSPTPSATNTSTETSFNFSDLSFEEMDYFEDHYLKKADSLRDQYEDICGNIESTFYDMFDLKRRIKMLEMAIAKYNEWKTFCYDKGAAGIKYFESDYSGYLNSVLYPLNRDFSGEYIFEFENREFCNIDFLISLHKEYVSKPEESKKHLECEKIFFHGGEEKYAKYLKRQSLPKDLMKIIKSKGSILQKDLYPLFDDYLRNDIQKTIKDLIAKDKITSVKSGSSYMLKIKKETD